MGRNLSDVLRVVLAAAPVPPPGAEALRQNASRLGATAVLVAPGALPPRDLGGWIAWWRRQTDLPIIVRGRADVAVACGADGVHLAPEDVPVALVRRIARRGFIIGADVPSVRELEPGRGADYWFLGPWQPGKDGSAPGTRISALVRHAEGRPCLVSVGPGLADREVVLAAGAAGLLVE